ncbi:MAG: SpoIID/LytB domain-containing protein [Nitrospirota bacterium]
MIRFFSRFILFLLCIHVVPLNAYASDTIRILILNDAYSRIPDRNEKIARLGSARGELLLSGTHYTGTIEVWRSDKGIYLVNELPLEEYIKDVVAVEVKPEWDMEALKAQAVISRTYALYHRNTNNGYFYHLASSVLNQVYKGKKPDLRVSYAVENTKSEVLTYNGCLIEAFYHSTCGGKTEDAAEVFGKSYPFLKPVVSPCTLSPYSAWEREIPANEIERALDIPGVQDIAIQSFTSTGRVKQVGIVHRSGMTCASATEFRKAIGWTRLPSTNFTVQKDHNMFLFTGKGYGHGVGLCQWCALEMAAGGKNYREILSFFFPGTTLQGYESH